jgi:membrane fusion protein (multidrug efflux system)
MSVKKQIVVVLIFIILVLSGYFTWQLSIAQPNEKKQNSMPSKKRVVVVETIPASIHKLNTIIEAVGTTKAIRTVNITPLSSGRVVESRLSRGDQVKENALLLELDSVIEEANVVEAKARLEEASSALKRSDSLKRSSAMSEAAIDNLVAQVKISRANLERATKRWRDRFVRAPFSGYISFSNMEKGAHIKEGEVIAVLDDLATVQVEFSVPESLFGTLQKGDQLRARAASFPDREFSGTIAAINTRIDSASRAFKVRGLIDNSDRALPAGMFVHVSIILDGTEAVTVPEEAIVIEGNQPFVYTLIKVEDSTFHRVERRDVSLGRRSFGFVELTGGISLGEDVITRGIQKVRTGSLVQKNSPRTPDNTSLNTSSAKDS